MTTIFLKIHRFFNEKKWLFVLFLLGVLALGGFSLFNLQLEEDITNVLPKDGELAKYEHLIEKTSSGNNLIFILKSPDKNIDSLVFAGNKLQNNLTQTIPDSLVKAISIVNDETAFLDLLNNIYGNLAEYLSIEDLQKINLDENILHHKIEKKLKVLFTPAGSMMKQSIINDPLDLSLMALSNLQSLQIDNSFTIINSCLISKDSTYLLGFVKLNEHVNENKQKALLKEAVNKTLNQLNNNSSIKHLVFGAPIISEENAQRIKKDIMLTVNIAVTLLLLGMAFYYKSIKVLPGFMIPILLGASVALAFLYFKQDYVSAISLGMGSVLLGTIIDYALHTLTHLRNTGNSESTIKHTAAPILAGSITTSTAFLCLLLINSKALTDLAFFAAFSMIFGAIFSIIVLPIIYKKSFKNIVYQQNLIDKIVAYPFHNNKYLVLICFAIVITSIFFIKNISFTKDLNELNYMPSYIAEAEKELNTASNTLQSSLFVIIEKENLNEALLATERLEEALKIDIEAKKIDEIKSATGLLFSEEKKAARLDNWNQFWTSEKKEKVTKILNEEAEKLGFQIDAFQPFLQQLEQKNTSSNQNTDIGLADNYIAINEKNDSVLSTLVIKLEKENKASIISKIRSIDDDISVIDKSNMIVGLINQVKSSLQNISFLLLALILIILFTYFKNIEAVLLAFLPVFLSWITTLGLMGIFHIPFNMLNIIIVIFIFGLGIDYAIFILNSLINDYRENENHFNTVKSSVLLSAFTTFVGIGVLAFAKHPALNSIATAGMIAIISVFFYAIIILPFLFQILVKNRINKKFEPITLKGIYDTFLSYSALIFGVVVITGFGFILNLLIFIPIKKRKYAFHQVFHYWAGNYIKVIYPKERRFFENKSEENFNKPSVIIANHQSLIDTVVLISLNVKTVVLTKNWVRKSPIFGLGARLADYYSLEDDLDETIENLKQKVKEGFSIGIFPEGTRSTTRDLIRFYRGAFKLASQLELDIVPVLIHGSIDTLHRNQFFGQRRLLYVTILERIAFSNINYGETDRERYLKIRDFFKKSYAQKRKQIETGNYFYQQILSNYRYKGSKILKEVKNNLKHFNNFEVLTNIFQNDKKTLIIDKSNGLVTLVQNLVNEKKSVTVLSKEIKIITACYLVNKENTYYENQETIQESFEQIIYVGNKGFKQENFSNISDDKTHIIEINLKTKQIKL